MSEEKQIEEMARDIYSVIRNDAMSRALASTMYSAGYRKQSEGEWLPSPDANVGENNQI